MKSFLGIDGGGTKTEFMLIDAHGRILGRHREGSAYYLEIGLDALESMLARGIAAVSSQARLPASSIAFAFIGLPAYGEDSRLIARLDAAASPALAHEQYRCGNDMVCGWAGAFAGGPGINIVAGTGSIAFGMFGGREARAGGWGELFSDEGSAHWVAREGLSLFSRMSDGRTVAGPLLELVRAHLELDSDLDLCARIYGQAPGSRSHIASLAPLIAEAARRGDRQAELIFASAVEELLSLIDVTRARLCVPAELSLPVSCSGGMFNLTDLVLEPLKTQLGKSPHRYEFVAPKLTPAAGAAVYAAECGAAPLSASALDTLHGLAPESE